MSLEARELYSSSNGDRWSLVRDLRSGRVFVRHEPNAKLWWGHITHRDRRIPQARPRTSALRIAAPDRIISRGRAPRLSVHPGTPSVIGITCDSMSGSWVRGEVRTLAALAEQDPLLGAADRYRTLRKFAPELLEALEFKAARSHDPTLSAIKLLQHLNRSGKREVPADAPMPFRKEWRRLAARRLPIGSPGGSPDACGC